jgi:hypothetical protein
VRTFPCLRYRKDSFTRSSDLILARIIALVEAAEVMKILKTDFVQAHVQR